MNAKNILILTLGLSISSLTFAEGGGDRTYQRMEKAREVALSARTSETSDKAHEDIAQEKPGKDKKQPHC